ncbi:borealin-2 [Nematolebias whitei]|uniref:borealin-2 n=1 Tax=Nematolebias whitei TaxID=451745 RepID=UPI001899E365|nr:borealin-2 [Nematolebias whitei]
MPPRRQNLARNSQNTQELQSRGMRRTKLALFIKQVEKEAQERMNEMKSKLDDMLDTVDKVFQVELMKMPPSLQDTPLSELLSEEEISSSEVSIAMKSESREMIQPLKPIPSRKLKSTDSTPVEVQRTSSKTLKGRRAKKNPTLAGSNSTGTLASTPSLRRVQSCLTNRKITEQTAPNQTNRRLRTVMSASDVPCTMARPAAHVTVTTAQGEMVSFSEETKDDINWELLDDVAWCQIQKLTRLMEYLTQQSHCQR